MAEPVTSEILQLPLVFKQGEDTTVVLTVVDATGAPITNPTGYTVRAQIRGTPTGPVLFEWNMTPGAGQGQASMTYTTGPPPVSVVELVVTHTQSLLFTWGSAVWDCVLTSPVGLEKCLAEGTVAIDPAITQ